MENLTSMTTRTRKVNNVKPEKRRKEICTYLTQNKHIINVKITYVKGNV